MCISVDIQYQAVLLRVVSFCYRGSTAGTEKTAGGANENDICYIIDITVGKYRHIQLFCRSVFKCDRSLNILHIILRHGENLLTVVPQTVQCCTAPELRELEAFLNCSAVFGCNRAVAGNVAVSIKICPAVQCYRAAAQQIYTTVGSGHTAADRRAASAH